MQIDYYAFLREISASANVRGRKINMPKHYALMQTSTPEFE